jgi:hypothetical protein
MSVYTTSTSAVLRIAELELHIGKEELEWGIRVHSIDSTPH